MNELQICYIAGMSSIPNATAEYLAQYALARSLNRQIHFHLGPTNSGKTFEALAVLKRASSGVYLAPLRLLAMEVRDTLVAAGVPCNLITGEERDIIEGARHTASTIEMMDPAKQVAVAIIDEIQMLADPDRGSAWTAALIGAPAKNIYICGSTAVTDICITAINQLNEAYHLHYCERKTPLHLEVNALCGEIYSRWNLKGKLQKGDAIIAFSRKDVLTLSARIRQYGYTVASIYGALSPEVRRSEAARFSEGFAQILVATDAIGMGLNLPIRRVVFSTVDKFDGLISRKLGATETRQIAGRAGRYGIYAEGLVSTFDKAELEYIELMLNTDDTIPLKALPTQLQMTDCQQLSDRIHSNQLFEILNTLYKHPTMQNNLFTLQINQNMLTQAELIDQYAALMPLKSKFIFALAPISLENIKERDYFLLCLKSVASNKPRALPTAPAWLSSTSAKHLEDAENLSKYISFYAWLSFKFTHIFNDIDQIKPLRRAVSNYIERALLSQAGYKQTSREQNQLY